MTLTLNPAGPRSLLGGINTATHVRTPTIYAAGSYVILGLSSSLNLVTCTLYVGRRNSMHECQCSSRRFFRNNGVKELPKRTESFGVLWCVHELHSK